MDKIRIEYIWHDCFVVELPGATLVFDYWLDCGGVRRDIPAFLGGLRRDVPLIVFVSHFHKDHYNPAIFGWGRAVAEVRYVVSIDVWKRMRHIVSATSVYAGPKVSPEQVEVLHPGGSCNLGGVHVRAFPSTDIGNAYMVEADGVRVFHAGDLNAWAWRDESSPQEVNKAVGDFRACLREILDAYPDEKRPEVDYCFFPVDSRIGSGYGEGARIFMDTFSVRHFFPMHFELADNEAMRLERRSDAMRFVSYAPSHAAQCVDLPSAGGVYRE